MTRDICLRQIKKNKKNMSIREKRCRNFSTKQLCPNRLKVTCNTYSGKWGGFAKMRSSGELNLSFVFTPCPFSPTAWCLGHCSSKCLIFCQSRLIDVTCSWVVSALKHILIFMWSILCTKKIINCIIIIQIVVTMLSYKW